MWKAVEQRITSVNPAGCKSMHQSFYHVTKNESFQCIQIVFSEQGWLFSFIECVPKGNMISMIDLQYGL